jgi:hypothetical protein
MDYKKRYEEILKEMKKLHDDWKKTGNRAASEIESAIPELTENDDEKIRKMLINIVESWKNGNSAWCSAIDICDNTIAWLKKQGSQKPAEWSEEDKEMINSIIDYISPMPLFFMSTTGMSDKEYTQEFMHKALDWLNALLTRGSCQ